MHTDKTRVKRVPKRGHYDKKTIYSILDKEFLCHVGFVHEGYPVVIPTLYGRKDDKVYIHGSNASRLVKDLKNGIALSLSIARVNGLVLARSAFHHSANYESVVVFGKAKPVIEQEEKIAALKAISDQALNGRWEEVRPPSEKELNATSVLKISLAESSAKIRTGGPVDEKQDYNLNIWAGVLPLNQSWGDGIPDDVLRSDLGKPPSLSKVEGKRR